MNGQKVPIELEEGWEIIQKGITKLINILEGVPDESPIEVVEEGWEIIQNEFTKKINIHEGVPDESPVDHMKLYSTIYSMCRQGSAADYFEELDYSKELYERYQGVYNDYLESKVLPAIQEKHDDVSMLHEVVKRWENHKLMVKHLSRCFFHLEHFYIPLRELPTLEVVGFNCFRKIIGEGMMKVRVKDAVTRLINREREGEETDQTLIKNVLQIFFELGNTQNMEDNSPPTTSQLKAPPTPRARAPLPQETFVSPRFRNSPVYSPTSSKYVPPMFRNSPGYSPRLLAHHLISHSTLNKEKLLKTVFPKTDDLSRM
ncbi:hypothetical protein MKX03_028937 [Papaver bracteatum]|nr:hypothetical protein MKX03_028937 [Papaver bracteatum]